MDMDENAGGAGATPRQNPAELLDQLVQMTTLADGVSWVGAPFQEMYPQLWDDYRKYIAEPMDLRTVRERLAAGKYLVEAGQELSPGFVRDVRLVFTNAMRYNEGNEYEEAAKQHLEWFNGKIGKIAKKAPAKKKAAKKKASKKTLLPPDGQKWTFAHPGGAKVRAVVGKGVAKSSLCAKIEGLGW